MACLTSSDRPGSASVNDATDCSAVLVVTPCGGAVGNGAGGARGAGRLGRCHLPRCHLPRPPRPPLPDLCDAGTGARRGLAGTGTGGGVLKVYVTTMLGRTLFIMLPLHFLLKGSAKPVSRAFLVFKAPSAGVSFLTIPSTSCLISPRVAPGRILALFDGIATVGNRAKHSKLAAIRNTTNRDRPIPQQGS